MIELQIPALIVISYALFALLVPAFGMKKEGLAQPLAVAGAGFTTLFSAMGLVNYLHSGTPIRYFFGGWEVPIGIEFMYDGLSAFFALVINAVTLFVLIYTHHISKKEFSGKRTAYYTLVMLMMLGGNS